MLKYAVLLFLICGFIGSVSAQSSADADLIVLKMRLNIRMADTGRFSTLQKIARIYLKQPNNKGLDSAGVYSKRGTTLVERQKKPSLTLRIADFCLRSEIEYKRKNIPLTGQLLKEAIRLEQINGNLENEAKLWAQLGLSMFWEQEWIRDLPYMKSDFGKASAIYIRTGNINKQVEMQYWMAALLFGVSKFPECNQLCLKIIRKFEKTSAPFIGNTYMLLSSSNRYQGNFNKSLFYILKGLAAMKKSGDSTSAGNIYGELAQVYQELGQTKNSIVWYRKTLEVREKQNISQRYLFRTAGFLAHELILEHRPMEALHEIQGLERRNKPQTTFDQGTLSQIKAYCYEALGNGKLAEYHYLRMLRLCDETTFPEFLAFAKFDIANFYVNQGRYKDAHPYLRALTDEVLLTSKQKDFELLFFKVDSAAGRYLSAIKHVRKYEQLKDSLFNTERSKQIEELQIQYQTANNQQSIKLLKKDRLLNIARVKDANNMRNMTLLGIAVLILFLALLYFSYRSKQRTNVEMNKKNLWLNQLVDEKEWLIKEVHHRVKNNLQIVMGLLQRQSAYIDNEKALAAIQNSEHRMQSIALIHQKLYQSESMALINMPEYIHELVTYLKESFDTGSRIHFQNETENFSLDVQHAVPLGLILNEAITNAIKYAFPDNRVGKIYIEITTIEEDFLMLQVKDDGIGLPQDFSLKKINSLGMNLMRGLSKQLGGKLEVDHVIGVTIRVKFKKSKLLANKRD